MRIVREIAGLIALGLLVSACTLTQDRQPASEPDEGRVIELDDYLGVLQVADVELGGNTLPFLFDTAGGATLLTPAVANAIGCEPFGRVTGFRHDGTRIDVPRCGKVDLHMGGLPLQAEAGIFDLMALMPEGAPRLGGIVSLQTLGARAWTLDMQGRVLVLETPASLAQRIRGMREIQVRTATQGGGAGLDLFLKVEAPQGDLWLEVDSGNAVGLILSPHALAQLGLEAPQDTGTKVPVTLDISGFGRYTAPAIIKDTIYDGLLDAGFLKAHRLSVDPASGRAWLQSTAAP